MSYHTFFTLAAGLKKPIRVPKGTLAACQDHIERVERCLGFETTQYGDNPPHWKSTEPKDDVDDELFCDVASAHNRWVRWLYGKLAEWSRTPKRKKLADGWHTNQWPRPTDDRWRLMPGNYGKPVETEMLTPDDAQTFWHGLEDIPVPAERWTRNYYVERMQHVYEVMRGAEREGVIFDAPALTTKQAAAVINLFSEFLDEHDMRLDVPRGRDYLASSYDGGYDWCDTHGAVSRDDGICCSNKKCDLRQELIQEQSDE